ncbi:glycosyltransferase family 2 protein [Vibrio coralliirubri]|uniref:glycosyltransferase family 2 protein n=1 Tax=Vibrio coralliirubri TaxID=1516159 RepID=UPI00062EAF85|nr:glycosyltransferase family 2 protein [Vibrio coralliirubri]CDS95349.1 conserved hypothetical protein [Vibrio coralliirubri]
MIVIPMAGMSSRFFEAGYTKPKYMLEAQGKTVFEHSVNSFSEYFSTETFLFIIRDVFGTYDFVKDKIIQQGIKNYHIVALDSETRGQAETVALGLEQVDKSKYTSGVVIFNIDTFRPNFELPGVEMRGDGYLEVFYGEGSNWSFAKTENEFSNKVIQTAEKKQISNLCSTGLYYFKSAHDFLESYTEYKKLPCELWEKNELYIAPLYNYLIEKGKDIRCNIISEDEITFCGVPDEYISFKNK